MKSSSAPKVQVEIDAQVQRQIRQHARSSMDAEICGVLIGNVRQGAVVIEHAIAGEGARQAGTHVTFTQETWAHVYQIKDAKYPNDRIVGWYHSHPGFGIFLSDHDLFIHKNFFADPNQVAWVVDPHSEEEGCFVWNAGEVARLERLTVQTRPGQSVTEPETPPDRKRKALETGIGDPAVAAAPAENPYRWAILTLSHLLMLLLGFAIGFFLFPPMIVERAPVYTSPGTAAPTPQGGHR